MGEMEHCGSIDLFFFPFLALYILSIDLNKCFRSEEFMLQELQYFMILVTEKKHIPLLLLNYFYTVFLKFILKVNPRYNPVVQLYVTFLFYIGGTHRIAIICV